MAEESQPDSDLNKRVSSLETGQQTMSQKIDQILGIVGQGEHAAQTTARQHEERKLDRPTTVAEEIRAQLDAKEARDKATADANETREWRARIDGALAGMTENAPEPPARGIEKRMGWR